ncbi:MAG: transposase [Bryobacterales bacterium]
MDRKLPPPPGRYTPENRRRVLYAQRMMTQPAVSLSAGERDTTLAEIIRTCEYEDWLVHAAHVRSTHVHLVVTAVCAPEEVMAKLKAYVSRMLNAQFGRVGKRWARHGSTVWLWDDAGLEKAVDYVVRGQGKAMALFVNRGLWPEYGDL